jgi:hypothetical protein
MDQIRNAVGHAQVMSIHTEVQHYPQSESNLSVDLKDKSPVSEQAHPVGAHWDEDTKTLTIRGPKPGEEATGYFIPYLGNAKVGTHTPLIDPHDPHSPSWVMTGPFSGCSGVMFSKEDQVTFGHMITEAPSTNPNHRPPPTVEEQIAHIEQALGAKQQGGVVRPDAGKGIGYVMWTKSPVDGSWEPTIIYLDGRGNGKVVGVEDSLLPP